MPAPPGPRQHPPIPRPCPDWSPASRGVSVLLPLPLAGAYDYLGPVDQPLKPGEVVRVPLGGREVLGVVWDRDSEAEIESETGPEAVSAGRLKWVQGRCDAPPFSGVQRRFIDWVAGYTLAAPGAVLRMALSVPKALEPPRPVTGYRLAAGAEEARGRDQADSGARKGHCRARGRARPGRSPSLRAPPSSASRWSRAWPRPASWKPSSCRRRPPSRRRIPNAPARGCRPIRTPRRRRCARR